jgi:hypothetical protein
MVVYDDTSTEPIRVFDSGVVLPTPETFGEYHLSYRTGDIVSPRIDAREPLTLEMHDFCCAIRDHTPLRSSPQLGLDVVRMIEAVDRSLAAAGAPVKVTVPSADRDESPAQRPAGDQNDVLRAPTSRAPVIHV